MKRMLLILLALCMLGTSALAAEQSPILGDEGRYIMLPEEFDSSIPEYDGSGYLDYNEGYFYKYTNQSEYWSRFESYVNALVNSGYYGVVNHDENSFGENWWLQYIGPEYSSHSLNCASDLQVEIFGDSIWVEHVNDIKTGSEPTTGGGGGGGGGESISGGGSSWNDTPKTKCYSCNGSGDKECSKCDGKGYRINYVSAPNYSGNSTTTKEQKEWCSCSFGKVDCTNCGGDGWVND